MTEPYICQVRGRLPLQCCGGHADQIFKCEAIEPPGHRHFVGEHTILHERMGNGHTCQEVENQIKHRGGLAGWCKSGRTPFHRIGF